MRHSFSLHQAIGAPEPRRRFTLSGQQFFQHRLSGVRELPQAGSPPTGGEFFAEPQRGIRRLRTAGTCRAPRQGECADAARAHKRVDTCGFHPLVNHPFPLESLAQIAYM